jgi:O-antigen ligase/tetratricopeptide (TPR) repeat protein
LPLTLQIIDGVMETIILLILVATPWVFGGGDPKYVHLGCIGIGALTLLWAFRQVVVWKLELHRCWVSALLLVLFLVSSLGLVALPSSVLSWLSPEAVRLYEQLLPQQREKPAVEPPLDELPYSPGTTLSLYPGATQMAMVDYLAAMLLFLIARHALATPGRLKRLAYVMLANGCLLAIFALIQKVRSPGYTIYGFYVPGDPFGPFINRNHFASYVNFSVFLGLGLFLTSLKTRVGEYRRTISGQKAPVSYSSGGLTDILQHPQAVWILVPLTVCVTSILASLSRGGILAMAMAMGLALLVWRRRAGTQNLAVILVIPLVALGILFWYGASPTIERIEQDHASTEGRFAIWKAGWDAFLQFPLVGTGFGTFGVVEPLYRPASASQNMYHIHAHNEYLEAMVEGGLVRLLLTIGLIALVLRAGWRGVLSKSSSIEPAMMLGAWAACITLAVQSFGEFGVHLPAIAGALAVTAGYLVGLAARTSSTDDPSLIRFHYFGVGPILAIVFAGTLAVVLFLGSWLTWQSEGYREFGLALATEAREKKDLALYDKAVKMLDGGIFYGRAYSRVRLERYDIENQRLALLETQSRQAFTYTIATQQVARAGSSLASPFQLPLGCLVEDVMQPYLAQSTMAEAFRSEQLASWKWQHQHLLAARDLTPLLFIPQLEIAKHVLPSQAKLAPKDTLLYWKQSDTLAKYLDRIKLLFPQRADTWFFAGELEWNEGLRDQALQSWSRSLALSEEFLRPIVTTASLSALQPRNKLSDAEIMSKLLPRESPDLFVKAAWALYPEADKFSPRQPFMAKAIEILEGRSDTLAPENQLTYGLAKWGMNQREQGLQHLLTAVRGRPDKVIWRLDLGRLYLEMQKYADAREQAQLVLQTQPANLEAALLLKKLDEIQRPGK